MDKRYSHIKLLKSWNCHLLARRGINDSGFHRQQTPDPSITSHHTQNQNHLINSVFLNRTLNQFDLQLSNEIPVIVVMKDSLMSI